ncbi:MAG: hypothetical protein E7437_04620 [Ruminococcaceae bacterium]|nr:hypothetical protein [Oscillospiraceae bacterium]
MKKLCSNLADLLKVKTLVTMAVVGVFSVLALKERISADNVMIIVSMVVSFYFGTQHEKKQGESGTQQ